MNNNLNKVKYEEPCDGRLSSTVPREGRGETPRHLLNSLSLSIRPAALSDIPAILPVLEAARGIMRASGNPTQWADGYPTADHIAADIRTGAGHVLLQGPRIVGYFAFVPSPEPTYALIEGGHWLDDTAPYHVLHRIAGVPDVHGVLAAILDFAFAADRNIRIDTHRDNIIMQHNLLKHGFTYCGIIYLMNGDERLAYQKILP